MNNNVNQIHGKLMEATKTYMDAQLEINQKYVQSLVEIGQAQISSAMVCTPDQISEAVKTFYKMAESKQ